MSPFLVVAEADLPSFLGVQVWLKFLVAEVFVSPKRKGFSFG